MCSPGSYSATVGSTTLSTCTTCAPGSYASNSGQSSCELCGAGYFSSLSGSSSCGVCQLGSYSEDGSESCATCTVGTYSPAASASACLGCPAGSYCATTGLSGITGRCASGAYSESKSSSCTSCAAGTFQGSTGASSCSACPSGTYGSNSGQVLPIARINCDAGNYQASSGLSICLPCIPGRFAPAAGSSTCLNCMAGSYQSANAAIDCFSCATGTSQPSVGSLNCASCNPGQYQDSTGAPSCIYCLSGSFNIFTGSTASAACQPCLSGYFAQSDHSSCAQCLSGQFADTQKSQCVDCVSGRNAPQPQTGSCISCQLGQFSFREAWDKSTTTLLTLCKLCMAGQFSSSTGATSCAECSSGQAQSAPAQSTCISCGAGTYSPVSGALTCNTCGPGTFTATSGASICDACISGSYSLSTASACTACASGYFRSIAGGVSCDSCSQGLFASAASSSSCMSCQSGSYSGTSAIICAPCAAGLYAQSTGISLCSSCAAGQYGASTGGSSCSPCPSGWYSNGAASVCTGCGIKTYGPSPGRTSCFDCGAGYYNSLVGASSCVACASGYYQSFGGLDSCASCVAGTFVIGPGAQICGVCTSGQYALDSGAFSCEFCPPGLYSGGAASLCTGCGIKTYGPTTGRSNCLECAPGYYNSVVGASSCVACPSGYYQSFGGLDSCASCVAGTFIQGTGAQLCTACAAGKYTEDSGASACFTCSSGTYSGAAASSCSACDAGFFQSSVGSNTCTSCPQGLFTVAPASSGCDSCPPGFYSGASAISCKACAVGTFMSATGSFLCTACNAGQFGALSAGSSCSSCQLGRYSSGAASMCTGCGIKTFGPSMGRSNCLECAPGYYNSMVGASSCVACSSGFFQAFSGLDSCQSCTAGNFGSKTGQSSCTECGVGKYSAARGATDCGLCAPGTSQGAISQALCTPCVVGTMAEKHGQSSCTNCEPSYWSHQGQANCSIARVNFYIDPLSFKSKACPNGAACLGYEYLPQPLSGHWVQRGVDQHVGHIYPCSRATCKGVDPNDKHVVGCWKPPTSRWSNCSDAASLLCTLGARGPLCGYCASTFVYSSALKICQSCQEASIFSLLAAASLISLAFLVFGIYTGRVLIPTRIKASWIMGMLRKIDSGAFRVSWSTYQIVQSVTWNLDVNYPYPFNSLLSILSVFSFDFISSACMFPESANLLSNVYLWSSMPAALSSGLVISYFVQSRRPGSNIGDLRSRHTYYALLMSYLTFPTVSLKQFQAMDCVTIAGRNYLRVDTSVSCSSLVYRSFRIVNAFFIIFYMSVPLSWLVLLFRFRSRLNPPTTSADAGLVLWMRDRDPNLAPIRFLFSVSQPRFYYWEALELYRRVAFIGVLPLLSSKADRRAAIGVLFSIVSLAVYGEVGPFQRGSTKILARTAQYTIFMTFGCALAIQSKLSKNANSLALGGALFAINLVVLSMVFIMAGYKHSLEEKKRTAQLERQALKIEWAAHFDAKKFATTFDSVGRAFIPPSHALVFQYTTLAIAQEMIDSGVPCSKHYRGIAVTLHSPKELDAQDKLVFPIQEVVLACSIPRHLLGPLNKGLDLSALRVVSSAVLTAVRGGDFGSLRNPDPWYEGQVLLPPRCIVRAYRLVEEPSSDKSDEKRENAYDAGYNPESPLRVEVPATCTEYLGRMLAIRLECERNGWKPLYHYTQPGLGAIIQSTGFRMSTQGQGDGGIYFSTLGPTSYELGGPEYERNIIVDCFGAGRLEEYRGKHKLDLCIVYGAEPWALSPAPGGRDNALMAHPLVSKATLEALSLPSVDGNYFLRKDRILGMFLLDPANPPTGYRESVMFFERERRLDLETKAALFGVVAEMNNNENSVSRFVSLMSQDEVTARAEAEAAATSVVAAAAASTWLVGMGRRFSERFSVGAGAGGAGAGGDHGLSMSQSTREGEGSSRFSEDVSGDGEFGHFDKPTRERARHVALNPMTFNPIASPMTFDRDPQLAQLAQLASRGPRRDSRRFSGPSLFRSPPEGAPTFGDPGGGGALHDLNSPPPHAGHAGQAPALDFEAAHLPGLLVKRRFAMGRRLSGLVQGQRQQGQQQQGQGQGQQGQGQGQAGQQQQQQQATDLHRPSEEQRLSGLGDSVVDF